MFKNPLKSPEAKEAMKELAAHNKEGKNKVKDRQRALARKIVGAKKNKEESHERRRWHRMQSEGDRTAEDYRG